MFTRRYRSTFLAGGLYTPLAGRKRPYFDGTPLNLTIAVDLAKLDTFDI